MSSTDPDPSAEMSLWLSSAPLHLWHPLQSKPHTEWEARIDELMRIQADALEAETRRQAFHEVQRIVSRELPILDLVVPHTLLAARNTVKNLRPSAFRHALWNSDELVRLPEQESHVAKTP
jgi:peptide/nickel transport system substrate-binding protein